MHRKRVRTFVTEIKISLLLRCDFSVRNRKKNDLFVHSELRLDSNLSEVYGGQV